MPEVLPSVHLIDLRFQDRRAALAAYLLVGPDGQAARLETGPTTTRAALLDGARVAGVRVPGAGVIHPPTVPPEFDPAAWERSIDRLLSLDPPMLLLAHFGPYTDVHAHLEELRRCLREWTDVVRAGLAAGRTPEEIGAALRQRDATRPGTSPEGMHRLDLVAGHGMSVAGIARYISRQPSAISDQQ